MIAQPPPIADPFDSFRLTFSLVQSYHLLAQLLIRSLDWPTAGRMAVWASTEGRQNPVAQAISLGNILQESEAYP
jgi:hypothetical protein